MKRFGFGPHGRLLFRSYLILAAALVVVATVLDFGFARLQPAESPKQDPWLLSTLSLIEVELAAVAEGERDERARELSDTIGVDISVLRTGDVYMAAESQDAISELSDAEGNISYLRVAPALDAIIRIGSAPRQRDSFLMRLLPPLFYLSIFIIVGL